MTTQGCASLYLPIEGNERYMRTARTLLSALPHIYAFQGYVRCPTVRHVFNDIQVERGILYYGPTRSESCSRSRSRSTSSLYRQVFSVRHLPTIRQLTW